ncbi:MULTISPECIES: multifunctional CCA addition/repair protein [Methylomonas]|uniref:Multifunctional CCA protein n=2 Tax=Methylomonas TaxID=416 RepID=A0A126T5J3_9GAMM|nr:MULTISPECIES: multifunctional CCA addition/repair protein [Methylomonas]AMK77361.1 multifunctional CCA tRNA nucleotidyl transferase/2'3'-cyclic phosphodiesterase/2'nucleotidase/phosphatase [Methylomonas denitrificans]OAI08805.1 multifunctional CCA tRNA nucleotidyl transferase/2'3'-cyclic phosphodiesterase/2'nucleotidase/phosphatase [Methylomonas methanica]TCV75709.1 tRNA nucleotidyltransferase (CCA-adding enzyme) [Methylomonas methanica]
MKTYLVGGAVRDRLLDFPVKERDWLVVGETADSMLAAGFRPVGKDFPVFLHPDTHEEYALARTERKTAPGYKGFAVYAAPDVTLEEDLLRRDLTVNAMAIDTAGELIDPYNGRRDLDSRMLRHVSAAFVEDPVRILRVARFAARYAHLGFSVATETLQLMHEMVLAGEADFLVAERVWAELHKALLERTPAAFFQVLKDCGALRVVFPEIDALFGVPQPEKYHPEIDTGVHALMVLEQAARLSDKAEVRLAALLHDLGKALTPSHHWPSHHGHEQKGLPVLAKLCERLRVPNNFKSLCAQVMQYHTHCHRALELRADTLTDMLQTIGAFKPDSRLNEFLQACEADARGRTGFEDRPYPQADYIRAAAMTAAAVDTSAALLKGLQGEQIGIAIRKLRTQAVNDYKQRYHQLLVESA